MTVVALIRHYPTAWNGEQRLQGQTDIPLTDQARETLQGLQLPPPWDGAGIIASPLSRAAETAQLLADGRAVVTDARLVELSWGIWEGRTAKDLLADPENAFRPTHEWDWHMHAPEGESAAAAWARVKPALADIAAGNRPVVIVTHKALMRLILGVTCAWQGAPEIKRGRLYPLTLRASGQPSDLGEVVRLLPKAGAEARN